MVAVLKETPASADFVAQVTQSRGSGPSSRGPQARPWRRSTRTRCHFSVILCLYHQGLRSGQDGTHPLRCPPPPIFKFPSQMKNLPTRATEILSSRGFSKAFQRGRDRRGICHFLSHPRRRQKCGRETTRVGAGARWPGRGWWGGRGAGPAPAASPVSQVLELYGNGVASMACLCAHPPPALQHLGLGHNKLLGPSQSRYVTREHW